MRRGRGFHRRPANQHWPPVPRLLGTATRLGQALDRARDELAGLPLAGLVMVSDGADTSDAAIDDTLSSLEGRAQEARR